MVGDSGFQTSPLMTSQVIKAILSHFSFIEEKKPVCNHYIHEPLKRSSCLLKTSGSWLWWHSLIILAPGKSRPEDQEFKVSVGYTRLFLGHSTHPSKTMI